MFKHSASIKSSQDHCCHHVKVLVLVNEDHNWASVCLSVYLFEDCLFGDEMNPVLYYADNPKTLRALKVVARAT